MEAPMDDEEKEQILNNAGPRFFERIEVTPVFMAQLVKREVISHYESADILALPMPSSKKQKLLEHLYGGTVQQFVDFCITLSDVMQQADIINDVFGLDVNQLRKHTDTAKKTEEASSTVDTSSATPALPHRPGEMITVRAEMMLPEQHQQTSVYEASSEAKTPIMIWMEAHPGEQDLVTKSRQYRTLINRHWEDLIGAVQMQSIWGHLRHMNVLDAPMEVVRRSFGTNEDRVEGLLNILLNSSRWKLHAFMRALCLSGQQNIVSNILNMDVRTYLPEHGHSIQQEGHSKATVKDLTSRPLTHQHLLQDHQQHPGPFTQQAAQDPNQPTSQEGRDAPPVQLQISEDMMNAIIEHSKGNMENLMYRNLFDLDDHPAAETINLSLCVIEVDVELRDRNKTRKIWEITLEDILIQRWYRDKHPRTVRLKGEPGTGKTTWMTQLAYLWSKGFLKQRTGKWKLMVYVPARSIKGSIEDAIRKHLWCKKNVELLMKLVEDGEDVGVLLDGIDEVRDLKVLKRIAEYVQDMKSKGGPTVFLSTRTNLCQIASKYFSIFLHIHGFTAQQGLDYVKSYFEMEESQHKQTILDYVADNKDELQPVLSNPLRLHIFCGLAAKGRIDLKDKATFNIAKLFEPLEKFLVEREKAKVKGSSVTEEDSKAFYRLCLYGLLADIREFSPELLTEFKVNDIYKNAFLQKKEELNSEAQYETSYSFSHEMVYEFFGGSYFKSLSLQATKALLLPICARKSLRNMQKILIELISRDKLRREQLLQVMIRAILTFQVGAEAAQTAKFIKQKEIIKALTNLPSVIQTTDNIKDLLLSYQDAGLPSNTNSIWDQIDKAFDVNSEVLRAAGWFDKLKYEGAIQHVVDCLKVCSPSEQEAIIQSTVHRLLPCEMSDHREPDYTVAAGSMRWAEKIISQTTVRAWCPQDMIPVMKYKQLGTDLHDISLRLNNTDYKAMWGVPPDNMLTQEAWTPVLQELLQPQRKVRDVTVVTPDDSSVPLDGLMHALQGVIKQGHGLTCGMVVVCGRMSETELRKTLDWLHRVYLEFGLYDLTVVLSEGCTIQDVPSVHRDLMEWEQDVDIRRYITADGQQEYDMKKDPWSIKHQKQIMRLEMTHN